MKLTRLCSHAPVAALLPARVGQPHWEGSSAIQVTGGAAGAIIVEDPKGSIPDYLEQTESRLLVLQQIATAELAGISGYAGDTTFHVDDAQGLPENWKTQVRY